MNQRERILPPYTRRVNDTQHRIVQLLGFASLVMLAMVLGFFIGIFGMYGWFIPTIPVALLGLIALWIAPDLDTRLDVPMRRFYFLYVALLMMWPSYLAFNVPGLPWISFQRVAMFLLVATTLYSLATSSRLRGEFEDILTSHTLLIRLFIAWALIETVMMMVGGFESTSRWVSHMMIWNFMFVMSAWVMSHEGMAQRLTKIVLIAMAITSAVVIPEYMDSKPIWADHIPSFLSIDPAILESLQFGISRGADYRSRSIFVNSIVYAEFVGMILPFVLLSISWSKSGWQRTLAVLLLALAITAGTLTQARTAMIVTLATIPTFAGLWAWRRYQATKAQRDIVAPAMLSLYPAAALTLAVAVLTIPRLRTMVFGGGQHQASNNAREAQWDMAIPQILKNPIGHGMGSIDRVVPYTNGAGKFTIDSYPINLLIEFGIPGFLVFVGFFITAIYLGIRVYLNAESRDEQVAGAAAVGIIAFLLARLVLSTEGGQGLAFGYSGVILALYWRQKHARRISG
jgi:O-antigen ligase